MKKIPELYESAIPGFFFVPVACKIPLPQPYNKNLMKLPQIPSLFFASALSVASVPALADIDFGNIAFVGDSITQGAGPGNEKPDKSLSYRYSLWKIFVSNGIAWNPVGSMSTFLDGSSASSSQTPDFLGNVYDNTSEGHYGWRTYDFLNGPDGRNANSGSGKLSEWLVNTAYYPDGTPDTVTLLLGVNDLSYNKTVVETAANAKAIIQQYQAKNPNVNVHVFSVLPTNQASWSGVADAQGRIREYNTEIQKQISAGEWNTENSTVQYHDITAGFDAAGHTSDNVHPNAGGTLLVAKNIASALGLNPVIDLRKTQMKASALKTQVEFAQSGSSWTATAKTGATSQVFTQTSATDHTWSVNGDGYLDISTSETGGSDIRLDWASGQAQEFTLELSVKMDKTDRANNFLGVFAGNGLNEVGVLYLGESGVFWGDTNTLLYGGVSETYKTYFATEDFVDIRIAYMFNENSTEEGRFYVWLNGDLIGDSLIGNTGIANQYKNTLLVGDIGSSYEVDAQIKSISFETGTFYQPILVPEPSAFGMLAGLGALALVASRRRRK